MEPKFHIGLGFIDFQYKGLHVHIYKPNRSDLQYEDDAVLFCNYMDGREYSYQESDLVTANSRVDKYIVDVLYKSKPINNEIFTLMKGKWIFTNENMVGESIIVGEDHIGKVISLLYNNNEWMDNLVQVIEIMKQKNMMVLVGL